MLALAREGYSWSTLSPRDLVEVLTYPGFYRLAYKYLGYGLDQMLGSLLIRRAVRDLRKFVPDLAVSEVTRGPAGVRAQAMSQGGDLVGDFIFHSGEEEKSRVASLDLRVDQFCFLKGLAELHILYNTANCNQQINRDFMLAEEIGT